MAKLSRAKKMKNLTPKKKKRPTKAESLAYTPIEEFGKMAADSVGLKKLADTVRTLQTGYRRRATAFKKKNMFSQAVYGMEHFTKPIIGSLAKFMKDNTKKDFEKRNILLGEIAKYQQFFLNKTSSIEGNAEVLREQDRRIFGADENGETRYQMNALERETYWALYNEYMKTFPTRNLESDQVQKIVGDLLFFTGSTDVVDNLTGEDFMKRLLEIEFKMQEKSFERKNTFNVLTGQRGDSDHE